MNYTFALNLYSMSYNLFVLLDKVFVVINLANLSPNHAENHSLVVSLAKVLRSLRDLNLSLPAAMIQRYAQGKWESYLFFLKNSIFITLQNLCNWLLNSSLIDS